MSGSAPGRCFGHGQLLQRDPRLFAQLCRKVALGSLTFFQSSSRAHSKRREMGGF